MHSPPRQAASVCSAHPPHRTTFVCSAHPPHRTTFLALLILFHLAFNAAVISRDHHFDIPDAADYYDWSLQIAHSLKQGRPAQALVELWGNQARPPLGIVPTALIMALWPTPSAVLARMSMLPWLALLMCAVYCIGCRLCSPGAGLVAAACAAAFPTVFGFSRLLWLDLPLSAMTALALLALLRTDYFRLLRPTLAFGIVAGLGLLTKHAFPLFMLAPALGYLVVALRRGRGDGCGRGRRLLHAAAAAAVALALFLLWLVPHFSFYIWVFHLSQTTTPGQGPQSLLAIPIAARFLYNLWLIPTALLGPVLTLAYLGSAALLALRDRRRLLGFTSLWFWGSLLLLSAFVNWPRYAIPALPAAALAIGAALNGLRGFGRRQWHLPLALALLCMLPVQATCFGPEPVWCDSPQTTARVFCAGMIRPQRQRIRRPSFRGLPRTRAVLVTVLPRRLGLLRPPELPPPPFDHIPEAVRYWMLEDGLVRVECNWEIQALAGPELDRNDYVVLVEGAGALQPNREHRVMVEGVLRQLRARPTWWREIMDFRFDQGPRLRLFAHRRVLDLPR